METRVEHSVIIAMPRTSAWERLRDLSLAHHYVPGLVGCELQGRQREGVGASRCVHQKGGGRLDETVTDWEEGHGFEIRLHRGASGAPAPFRTASFRYRIDEAGPRQTRLTASMRYTVRWGAAGRLLDALLLRAAIRRNVQAVADGLRNYYESSSP